MRLNTIGSCDFSFFSPEIMVYSFIHSFIHKSMHATCMHSFVPASLPWKSPKKCTLKRFVPVEGVPLACERFKNCENWMYALNWNDKNRKGSSQGNMFKTTIWKDTFDIIWYQKLDVSLRTTMLNSAPVVHSASRQLALKELVFAPFQHSRA